MSRGCWDYTNERLMTDIFGYKFNQCCFGDEERAKFAIEAGRMKPLIDSWFSELVYDIFAMLRTIDTVFSGDSGIERFNKDFKEFGKKYRQVPSEAEVKVIIDERIKTHTEELRKEILSRFEHVNYTHDDY